MAARKRPRALKPSFVVTTAAAVGLAACDGAFEWLSDPKDPQREREVSVNPPPPPPQPLPSPDFGATVTQQEPPPALGAASMVITADGASAIVSDPDRDRVVVVELGTHAVREIALEKGDEPGRLVEAGGRAHVVLRRAGKVATIDPATAKVIERRDACAAPEGIAHDGSTLFVSCAGGEIVTMPAAGGEPAKLLTRIDRDLRDIAVVNESLLVSRLRKAEVLRLRKSDGSLLSRGARPRHEPEAVPNAAREPSVGWRLATHGSRAVLVHQMAQSALVDVEQPQSYAGTDPCAGSVVTALTSFDASSNGDLGVSIGSFVGDAVAPVDLAFSHDDEHLVLIAAGNGHTTALPQVQLIPVDSTAQLGCVIQPSSKNDGFTSRIPTSDPPGQAVAVAFTPDDRIVVFTREPAAVHVRALADFQAASKKWTTIPVGGASREDTGHAIFHSNTGGNIACVSCHPGGGDDGRVWQLSGRQRRTQSLQGTLDGTAPYHWAGDAEGIETFATDVFASKMGGPTLAAPQVEALRSWLVRLPAPRASAALDAEAVARGKATFESEAVGCASCHSGPKRTNNESVDVGTGGVFQVPPLVGLGNRAPYLHDGRAATLLDVVTRDSTDAHGKTSVLSNAEVLDLALYLDSL